MTVDDVQFTAEALAVADSQITAIGNRSLDREFIGTSTGNN
nr:hypothetical protein [Mycobacterium leprae]